MSKKVPTDRNNRMATCKKCKRLYPEYNRSVNRLREILCACGGKLKWKKGVKLRVPVPETHKSVAGFMFEAKLAKQLESSVKIRGILTQLVLKNYAVVSHDFYMSKECEPLRFAGDEYWDVCVNTAKAVLFLKSVETIG